MHLLLLVLDYGLPSSSQFFLPHGDVLIQSRSCVGMGSTEGFRQSWNTYSSIAFFSAAVFCFLLGKSDQRNPISEINYWRNNPQIQNYLAAAITVLFLGSTIYHITLSLFHYGCDLTGVFLLSLFPTFYQLVRGFSPNFLPFSMALLVLCACTLAFGIGNGDSDYFLFSFLLINIGWSTWNILRIVKACDFRYLLLFYLFAFIAYFCIYIDIHFCSHLGDVGGHAFWHIFAAISFIFFMLYFRSEREY